MSAEYPLKDIRLQQLHDSGFNVANFLCFPPHTLSGREEELRVFLKKHGRISCRHFHDDEKTHFKCPVLYDQTDIDVILKFCLEHNQTFYTLCNEAITLDDSICAGNILVLNEQTYFIEYFHGPGTPRDIESKGSDELKTFNRTIGQPAEGVPPSEAVLKMAYEARKFNPYPIGKRQDNIICWGWRWGWLHYQLQANQFLLKENERLINCNQALERQLEELRNRFENFRSQARQKRLAKYQRG
ncbi:MAG: hypothetical protein A3B86_01155 [Candidatus Yanofskybacteria bacterium RIFCSPHIGHO2_02_FULL_38_22b]|uniref:Uncharacterized protein n=1 Tax=Candidatus Yanofskybacteria bacterium RIFCSPHIGHO2_02_FULL_38_22b TaxID=1802673 RepID=A0A1F8F2I9_9BACT|nr:MAG: hypothetical protein A3B86_01155 [Candidatus Yanofskybacteria bacterium RIFCSPHIGHO2_02_FULL_38_22b]OGN20400.1 MAG: hypothetical protein A2910_01505 [Candidatus Yanofskybacteria bacterium RIFCSPLOWO2_01_FULL_39_28]